MYKIIGKAAVKGIVLMVRLRYGKQLRVAAGVGIAAALLGGYLLATRGDAPEG
ncbi:MAG: hypothetical protein ACXWZM_01300 [Solirubrobacterales bacterium]